MNERYQVLEALAESILAANEGFFEEDDLPLEEIQALVTDFHPRVTIRWEGKEYDEEEDEWDEVENVSLTPQEIMLVRELIKKMYDEEDVEGVNMNG